MSLLELQPADAATEIDEDHYVCCLDTNRSLCGTDVEEIPFDSTAEVTCVVCCDLGDTPFCPILGACPNVVT